MADTTATKENEQLIEQMLADATSTGRGGDRVVHRGDEDQPAPMVMQVEDEGLVTIYDRLTGRAVKVLRYLLPDLLKRSKNPDGTRRWTTAKPDITPAMGTLKCFLHADDPNRAHYNTLGLPVCRKSNITSPYMVEQHMKHRHPSAYKIIEKERADAEKQEERDFQRSLMMGRAAPTVAAAPKKTWSRQPKNKKKPEAPEAKAPA